jgi:hypothetical protein
MSLKLASRGGLNARRMLPRAAFAPVSFARRTQSSASQEGQQRVCNLDNSMKVLVTHGFSITAAGGRSRAW